MQARVFQQEIPALGPHVPRCHAAIYRPSGRDGTTAFRYNGIKP